MRSKSWTNKCKILFYLILVAGISGLTFEGRSVWQLTAVLIFPERGFSVLFCSVKIQALLEHFFHWQIFFLNAVTDYDEKNPKHFDANFEKLFRILFCLVKPLNFELQNLKKWLNLDEKLSNYL